MDFGFKKKDMSGICAMRKGQLALDKIVIEFEDKHGMIFVSVPAKVM
jgi:hypothetical protein